MAPIRKGDGTPLEIPGVQEVRSGDGRVFFDGDAIPDTLVDDFEWGGPVGDRYSEFFGTLDSWSINQNAPVFDGDYSLKFRQEGSSTQAIVSNSGDGLNYYPEVGDEIWWWAYSEEDGSGRPAFFCFSDSNTNDDMRNHGVGVMWRPSNGRYVINFNGSFFVVDTTVNTSADTWHLTRIMSEEDGNGGAEIKVVTHDGPEKDDDVLEENTLQDSSVQFLDDDSVGFWEGADQDNHTHGKIVAEQDAGISD